MGGPPRHLWLVGGASLIWNAMGVVDFLMVQAGQTREMALMAPAQAAWFAAAPSWLDLPWGLAASAALMGSALLLMRHRAAAAFLGAGFAGLLLLSAEAFLLAPVPLDAQAGPAALQIWAAMLAVALTTWLYAWGMTRGGWLG